MSLSCRIARTVPEEIVPGQWIESHRSVCLRCQVDVARDRGISRELAALSREVVPAPPTLAAGVLARIGVQDAANPRRPMVVRVAARYAATAGVAAATAVALAGGAIRRRSRVLG